VTSQLAELGLPLGRKTRLAPTSDLANEILQELLTIERTLWENNAEVYRDTYAAEAVLIFPGVGRIDRETAIAAIKQENAEGHAWAEVRFDDVVGHWLTTDTGALISYVATARWNYQSTASQVLCATAYVRRDGAWRVALHQQTSI
jgi:Domain of unknown function (DUF4440)